MDLQSNIPSGGVGAHDFFAAILQVPQTALPTQARLALEVVVECLRHTDARLVVPPRLRELLPPAPRAETTEDAPAGPGRSSSAPCSIVPQLVIVHAPQDPFSLWVPNFSKARWLKVRNAIESSVLRDLVLADGYPLLASELQGLVGSQRRWYEVVDRINGQIPSARGGRMIETRGITSRGPGRRRRADEGPDERVFFVRRHAHWVGELQVGASDDIEATLADRFGKPVRPSTGPQRSPPL